MKFVYPICVCSLAVLCGACDTRPSEPTPNPPVTVPIPSFTNAPTEKLKAVDPKLDVPDSACDESKNEHELVGRWELVSGEINGVKLSSKGYYEFKDNTLSIFEAGKSYPRTFEIDPGSKPRRLDSRQVTPHGTIVFRAIYRVDGDTLTISDSKPFTARPKGFVDRTTAENELSLVVLRRARDPR